jgi:hypothetical protein
MTRYSVTWTGTIEKTIAIQTPADALYHVWSRYRNDFPGGRIEVGVEHTPRGAVRLAQLSFPAVIRLEIEAADAIEATRSFLYDDRVPSCVHLAQITVETLSDQPMLELVEAAE